MILRHAKAVKDKPMPDRDRPLTEEGREQIKLMRRHALAAGLVPELVLTSDALRARTTAEDFCKKFVPPPALVLMREIYDAGGDDILALVRVQPDSVTRLLLVGHNPALEGAVMQLCAEVGPRKRIFQRELWRSSMLVAVGPTWPRQQ